ncbi:anti-sigma factor domain-containing protein [Streptomyces sp. NPDC056401]|uniref:anti-sigma factor n=1 Tax=Streptomyces sp. NPDC056401 TaxID=3345809 RepID=UPI0035E1CED8
MKHDGHLHTLTGAYALDALTGDELRAFATHLEHCESCVREARAFEATSSRLAAAISLTVPVELRQEVLHHIETVRQAPPRTDPPVATRFTGASRRRAGACVVAAGLAAAAAFGGLAVRQRQETEQQRARVEQASRQASALAAIVSAPDARTTHGRTSSGAITMVITSSALNQAVFVSNGLPAPPPGTVYQLWFEDQHTPRSAGLVHDDGATVMDGTPAGARSIGLTLEPVGGSSRPTTRHLILLALPA